jgi:predicted O-linked N-acetylglucosamine transferase (SPINDLY family)
MTLQEQFKAGLSHHQAGRLAEAETLYRQVLAQRPDHVDALHLLGVLAAQTRRYDVAVDLIGRAIALRPNFPEAHNNLGNALLESGHPDQAVAACRRAVELKPNYADAHYNLGNALRAQVRLEEAVAAYRQAVALRPGFGSALSNLGIALNDMGEVAESIAAHRQAVALMPNMPEAHNNLGLALKAAGRMDEAIAECRRAIALRPDCAEAFTNLGVALKDNGQFDDAIAAARQAVALKPDFAEGYTNVGTVLRETGEIEEAIAAYRRAVSLRPDLPAPHSNLLFTLHYHQGYDPQAVFQEHRRWDQQHAEPLKKLIQPYSNVRDPDRPLRIGYVSADFWEHPVGRFVSPLLRHHDRRQFEIYCYSNSARSDGMTARLRSYAGQWRQMVGVNDEQAAAQIRDDAIDILVDLSGHTAGNRLLVFARRPAAIQMSYLGYPGTTGLSAIDYRLTDGLADPAELTDRFYSERLYRLARTNWCFAPPDNAPAVQLPPVLSRGYVTFGSFNNFAKVTDSMLKTWAEILRRIPHSRLLLKAKSLSAQSVRRRVESKFSACGIDPDRLELCDWQFDHASHLTQYGEMDIALDTFPYGGTTTTCDALWMGVPVVTLAGQTHVSRVGLSLLSNVGLPETIATTGEAYIDTAVALAEDHDRLKRLRAGVREQMKMSPLMDAEGFARDVESAYRQMWRGWCETALT